MSDELTPEQKVFVLGMLPDRPTTPATQAGRALVTEHGHKFNSQAHLTKHILAIEAEVMSICPFCKQCRVGTDDADRHDCGCDGPCCWNSWDEWLADLKAEAVKPWREAITEVRNDPCANINYGCNSVQALDALLATPPESDHA